MVNSLLGRSKDHVPVKSLQLNDVQSGPSQADITKSFHDEPQLANTNSSFVRKPRGSQHFFSFFGNNDAQQLDENLQTYSQNFQVAVNLTDNVDRPNHLSTRGDTLNLTSNDTNQNNSEQQKIQAVNLTNNLMHSTPTNIHSLVNQSTCNQNLVANTINTKFLISQPFSTQIKNAHVQSRHNRNPNFLQDKPHLTKFKALAYANFRYCSLVSFPGEGTKNVTHKYEPTCAIVFEWWYNILSSNPVLNGYRCKSD